MSSQDQADIDTLLDATLDDLADLPEFKIFPAGAYNGTMELNVKKMGDNTGVEFKFTNQEVVELSDPTQEAPAVGATTTIGYQLNNDIGQGALKKVLESIKEGMQLPDGTTNRELMELSKGANVQVVFSSRADKNDATKVYQKLVSITVQ